MTDRDDVGMIAELNDLIAERNFLYARQIDWEFMKGKPGEHLSEDEWQAGLEAFVAAARSGGYVSAVHGLFKPSPTDKP